MLGALLILMAVVTPSGQPLPKQPSDYTPAGQPNVVSWQLKRLPPPSALYVGVDDVLRVTAATSQANEVVTVNYRLLRAADGVPVYGQFIVRPASTRLVAVQDNPLAEGFLMSVSCQAAVATTRGQTFVRLLLNPKALGPGQPAQMLMADYVTTQMASAYPNGRVLAPTEGPGVPIVNFTATIPTGNDWQINVPANTRWRVIAIKANFVASAVVANRFILLRFSGVGQVLFDGPPNQAVTANGAVGLSATALPATPAPLTNVVMCPLPPGLVSLPAFFISSVTQNLDAGDKWSVLAIFAEEWLDNV